MQTRSWEGREGFVASADEALDNATLPEIECALIGSLNRQELRDKLEDTAGLERASRRQRGDAV
jgi:hypothetical protein